MQNFTDNDKAKLDSIELGAQQNMFKATFYETDNTSDSYVLNADAPFHREFLQKQIDDLDNPSKNPE